LSRTIDYYIRFLLLAIKSKWPAWCPKKIYIQQDTETPHPKQGKEAQLNKMQAEMYARGRDVKFVTQQANSPDLNTPDFALFRAIVAVQEGCCKLQ
jgi:hypothetical protein